MKRFFIFLLFPVFSHGQKIAPYKYGEVDTIWQYNDAQIIYYKDKRGAYKSDTIWYAIQKKEIEIDWAHEVIKDDRFLKPKFKTKNHK